MDIFTLNIFSKGGFMIFPIILGSIAALGLTIERAIYFRRLRCNTSAFSKEILGLVENNQNSEAVTRCNTELHPLAPVFAAGINSIASGPGVMEREMEREGALQVTLLEKNLPALITIVGIEPMMGFLGTIIGLIKAFMNWEKYGTSVTVEQLASGIYQAMVTTAAGLAVAIPFYVAYNLYTARVNRIASELNYFGDALISAADKGGSIR